MGIFVISLFNIKSIDAVTNASATIRGSLITLF